MLSVPPPTLGAAGGGGAAGALVLMNSTVVCVMVWPAIAAVSTEFGLFTIVCVMLGGIGFGSRKVVGTDRLASLKGGNATAVFGGGGLPIGKGRMLTGLMVGPPATVSA